jgi:EAL domain-containing protein (putative c-di-GMP-specific phosphodiesterase class I)
MTAFAPGDQLAAIYAALDAALAQAGSQSLQSWACSEHDAQRPAADERQSWHDLLDQALNQGRFQLYVQPVVSAADPARVLHLKVLARLLDEQDNPVPAGRFLPWLERFGWATRLDLAMLDWVLAQLQSNSSSVALSLSGSTIRDPQALQQLYERLRQHAHLGARLTLELDEDQLPDAAALEALTVRLRSLGFGLGLQHFGGRFSMIGNLAKLGLSYLKVDGSYIRAIDAENDKRLFIEAMQRAANSIDLPLIAERVETDGEWQALRDMGIEGVQGRLFGEPGRWT